MKPTSSSSATWSSSCAIGSRISIKKGMTLEQVKAARPTRDYDSEYVTKDSVVTADRFVEAVYTSLSKK